MRMRMLMLTTELGEAELELRNAQDELFKAESRVRKANGWVSEILRLLAEEDKHD